MASEFAGDQVETYQGTIASYRTVPGHPRFIADWNLHASRK